MNNLKKYINDFFEPKGMDFPQKQAGVHKFTLHYEHLVIGYLQFQNDEWIFSYSDEFKAQDKIQPITDFPDKTKVYKNSKLWPFFAARIPSISTPYVERKVLKEKIELDNIIEMLKAFGERSINNPFRLTVG